MRNKKLQEWPAICEPFRLPWRWARQPWHGAWPKPNPHLFHHPNPALERRQYVRGTGGVLADDMGLGKTVQVGSSAWGR